MNGPRRISPQAHLNTGLDAAARGVVVLYSDETSRSTRSHEKAAAMAVARALAQIQGYELAGEYEHSRRYIGPLYFVPNDSLTLDAAQRLGIFREEHLFGGVVPFPFVATKTITHPLVDAQAQAPDGWSFAFPERVQPVVLPGFSAFSLRDARSGGMRLLDEGTVRLKLASGVGGSGQSVITNARELDARLVSLAEDAVHRDGLIVERNLVKDITTYSVGRVRVRGLTASYFGTQKLATNNRGEKVYGGSDFTVARGDFDALVLLARSAEVKTAIDQARCYHDAAMASFPGLFASRCNYDVAQGIDDAGRAWSGVLEQSWRIGGASGAEVAALQAFRADPALQAVNASTTEAYGPNVDVPSDAFVYYSGIDEHVGPVTKYSRWEPYAHP